METLSFLNKNKITWTSVIFKSVLAALLSASCIRPAHKSPDANSLDAQEEALATFTLRETTATLQEQDIDPSFNIPTSRKLTFNACIQDKRTLESVIGHTFRVEGGDSVKDLKTNISGCLVWSEIIPFNFFAKSTFVAQQRKVIATGIHSGRRTMRFAFRPWDMSDNYIDLNFNPKKIADRDLVPLEKASDAILGKLDNSQKVKLPTWPDSLSIQSIAVEVSNKSSKMKLHSEMAPSIYLTNSSGKVTTFPLTNGLFDYNMYFVVESKPGDMSAKSSDNKKLVVFEIHSKKPVKMNNLKLQLDEVVEYARTLYQGELRLALQLIPANAPESLTAFHGVYTLGDSSTLVGGFSPKLIDGMNNVTQDFQITSYLNGAFNQDGSKLVLNQSKLDHAQATLTERESLNMVEMRSFNIQESPWSFGASFDGQSQKENQQFVDRDLTFKACITNPNASKTPIIGETFEIQSFTGVPIKPITTTIDNGGCLIWVETFKNISYYSHEIPKEGMIVISNKGSQLRLPVAIDPLNPSPMFDLRMAAKRQEVANLKASATNRKIRLNLRNFAMAPRGDQVFAIDRNLNLDTSQSFNFDLASVKVRRSDRIDNTQAEALRDGYYLLRVGIEKYYIDHLNTENCKTPHKLDNGKIDGCERRHITTSQKVVQFIDGHIQDNILTFFFTDWRFLRVINNILVELYPIDFSKFSAKDLDKQMAALNVEFSGMSKSPEAIAKFDSLIDKTSDIYSPENFVGQVVPLEQFNYDSTLYYNNEVRRQNSCETKSCGKGFQPVVEFDAYDSNPETAKFRLGNYHLIGTSVEDLMNAERQELAEFQAKKDEAFSLANFAKSTLSDLVLINTNSVNEEIDGSVNAVIPAPQKGRSNIDAFLKLLGDRHKINAEMISQFISYSPSQNMQSDDDVDAVRKLDKTQYEFKREFATHLCKLWFKEYLPGLNKAGSVPYLNSNQLMRWSETAEHVIDAIGKIIPPRQIVLADDLARECKESIEKNAGSVFVFEQKIQISDFKQTENSQPLGTFGIDVSSSKSTSYGISNSVSTSSSVSFNPMAFIGLFSKSKILNYLSPFGVSVDKSWSRSKSNSADSGSSGGASVSLNVDQESIRLNINEYDSCMTIRLNPAFIESQKLIDRVGSKDPEMPSAIRDEKLNALGRGILICSGQKAKQPIVYNERYFFLRQSLNDPTVTRKYDFRNNPYSFQLRGENELQTFFALTGAKADPTETDRLNTRHNMKESIEERMKNMLDKHPTTPYRQPSYPGVISID